MKVRYTETALADIDEILAYIAAENPIAADRVASQVEHTIGLIGRFPELGRLKYRNVVRMLPVRRYPQYLVFYAIRDDEVVVLNVRHSARLTPWDDQDR